MAAQAGNVRLGIKGAAFTLNDQPAFLLGISYYGALGAGEETIQQDLDEMQRWDIVNYLRTLKHE